MKKIILAIFTIMLGLAIFGCGKTAGGDGGGGGSYTPAPQIKILAKISGAHGSYIPIRSDGTAGDPIIIPASGNIVASSIPVFYADTSYWYMAKDDDTNNIFYRQWGGDLGTQTQHLRRDSRDYTAWDNWFNTEIDNKVSAGLEHDLLVKGKDNNFAVFFNFQPVNIDNFEAADWHNDGTLFYIDKADHNIKSINIANGAITAYNSTYNLYLDNNSKIALSPDGTKIASTEQYGAIISEIGNSQLTYIGRKGISNQPSHILWLDNDTVLISSKDSEHNGEVLRKFTVTNSHLILPNSELTSGTYQNIAYSSSDKRVYYLHPDGLIHYYSLEDNTDHIFSTVANIEGFALRK